MAKINRSDIIQKAVNELAISVANDKVPTETLDKVQLTYSLNKNITGWTSTTAGTSTGVATCVLPTIDTRSEIYITSVDFNYIKDVTCDAATGQLLLQCTPFEQGIGKSLLALSIITLTAQTGQGHIDFAYPMRLKANTPITATGTYTAGVMVRSISAAGFTVSTN